jgi:hypothetical protein
MAFDIYAGGFSRFYAREWENVMQKHARETGMQYKMIHTGGEQKPPRWEEVQQNVSHWKAALKNGLRENAPDDLDWSEERDAPYFTDRPGWDGYAGLVLLAASTACNSPLPPFLPKDALNSDIIVRAQGTAFGGAYRSIIQAQLWLPAAFDYSFDFVDFCDQKVHVASVRSLEADLRALQQAHQITEPQLQKSLKDAYEDSADFMSVARFGLAILLKIASEAAAHKLPIMLSY